jgi:hypothetical protein
LGDWRLNVNLAVYIAYRALPGWPHGAWSFLLTPGWESLCERPLVEIAAQQWRVANEPILTDLDAPLDAWCAMLTW